MTLVHIDDRIDQELVHQPGWCTSKKAKRLVRLASAMADAKPGLRAVELGVYGGRSLIALALGLQHTGSGTIDGIDSWAKSDCLEGEQSDVDKQLWGQDTDYEALYKHSLDGLGRFGVSHLARIVRKRTDDALTGYTDGSIDLIHLDGNHSELVSVRDVTNWLPKMAPFAMWIADDTNWPSMQRALGLLQQSGFKLVENGEEGYWSVFMRGTA